MTKRLSIVAALSFAIGLPLMTATVSADEVKCRVPFSFSVAGRTLAPGTYRLATQGASIFVRGDVGGAIALSNRASSRASSEPRLVFEKYGDHYTLREVWMGGGTGVELIRTRADQNWRTASLNAPVEIVVLPLK